MEIFILTQVKRTNGAFEKGAIIKHSLEDVLQSYHAYLGAYGYGHDVNTDYVLCEVMDACGNRMSFEFWDGTAAASSEE